MKIYLIDSMRKQKIISKKLASELLTKSGHSPKYLEINWDQAIPVESGRSVLWLQGGTK